MKIEVDELQLKDLIEIAYHFVKERHEDYGSANVRKRFNSIFNSIKESHPNFIKENTRYAKELEVYE